MSAESYLIPFKKIRNQDVNPDSQRARAYKAKVVKRALLPNGGAPLLIPNLRHLVRVQTRLFSPDASASICRCEMPERS